MSHTPLFAQAIATLESDGCVAYPTETVWGLAAKANALGLASLQRIKGRSHLKAVQVSCTPAVAHDVMAQPQLLGLFSDLLPGPLTLVVRCSETCPPEWQQDGWIGLRFPDHPLAQSLIETVDGALLTTSCNPSGWPAATTYQEALDYALADVTLPDPYEKQSAKRRASTVVRMTSERAFEVLREGDISAADIAKRLRPV